MPLPLLIVNPRSGGRSAAGDLPHVLERVEPTTGIINLGTGGDFRRSLGIDQGLEKCLEAPSSAEERTVEVGRASFCGDVETQYFVNVLSAGLGGLVDRYIERMPSFIGGRVGYYLAALGPVVRSKERAIQARIT